jgi:[ribosomal protein S5]-alanine N-acetyltransferase
LEFTTENYRIRPLVEDDVDERYVEWLRNPDISRTLDTDGSQQTLESVKAFVRSKNNETSFVFGIFTNDGTLIGTHGVHLSPQHKVATIGVMIGDQDYWGKGVPLETRTRMLTWFFDELDFEKVEAGCYAINYPSIFNFKKQSWRVEGVRKSHRIVDGDHVDLILFGLLKADWHDSRKS